jgi:regulator of replication initiation timing
MTRRRLLLGTLWGFVALAFLGGVVVGAVLPLWQRAALQNDMRVLQQRLAAKESGTAESQKQIEDLKTQVASLETSAQALASENSQLAAELAALRAAPAVPTATVQQETAKTGSPVITERSVSPDTVAAGGSVTLVVKTKGACDKVTMRIDGPSGSSYDYTFSLKKVSTEGDVTTWRTVLKAPGAGTYRCIASAIRGSARATASTVNLTVN